MSGFQDWITEALVATVIAVVGGLFARLRRLEHKDAANSERLDALEGSDAGLDDLRSAVHDVQLCMERNFVRRDQWVPTMSRIEGMLEEQGKLLVRLEERQNNERRAD